MNIAIITITFVGFIVCMALAKHWDQWTEECDGEARRKSEARRSR